MAKQIFVNLPVKDLNKSIWFFGKLGYKFNPQFTNEKATCMIIGENIFAMLLTESFFKTFTQKELCDSKKFTETIIALSQSSREEVDNLVNKAVKAGGTEPKDAQDHGWMYTRSFEDLDGHIWEILYMDEKGMPAV
jgi:predicted lactoylglutathione lyase